MIELAAARIEAAHQRLDGARAGIQRHEGALDLGQLGQRPAVAGQARALEHPHHGATPHADLGVALGDQARGSRLQAAAGDLHRLAGLQHGLHPAG